MSVFNVSFDAVNTANYQTKSTESKAKSSEKIKLFDFSETEDCLSQPCNTQEDPPLKLKKRHNQKASFEESFNYFEKHLGLKDNGNGEYYRTAERTVNGVKREYKLYYKWNAKENQFECFKKEPTNKPGAIMVGGMVVGQTR